MPNVEGKIEHILGKSAAECQTITHSIGCKEEEITPRSVLSKDEMVARINIISNILRSVNIIWAILCSCCKLSSNKQSNHFPSGGPDDGHDAFG